jgi:hypothetical protein
MADDHRTEAACLLEQGAQYRSRVGLERVESGGDPIFSGFKHGAFSLYFGDAPIFHFDMDGRWQRAFVDGVHYLKGLDATVHAIDRVREGANLILKRRSLADEEASNFDSSIRSMAMNLWADLNGECLRRMEPPAGKAQPLASDDLREFLQLIRRWDAARWAHHRDRYRATYGRLSFLPPECQNAVVLQAARGNVDRIGFGLTLTSDHPLCALAEFEQHANDVHSLWGKRLLQSRIIFIAGSDLLREPPETVVNYLDVVRRTFPIEPKRTGTNSDRVDFDENRPRFDGVHAFLEDFTGPGPDRSSLTDYVSRGLVRVSLGVESGDPAVRTLFQKRWTNNELVRTVSDLKSAGLGVSILTLVGAGGCERAASHVEDTGRLINSLALAPGDFVFLLDENELRDPSLRLEDVRPLQGSAWSEQQAKLKEALVPLKRKGVKVLPYTMEKQWT